MNPFTRNVLNILRENLLLPLGFPVGRLHCGSELWHRVHSSPGLRVSTFFPFLKRRTCCRGPSVRTWLFTESHSKVLDFRIARSLDVQEFRDVVFQVRPQEWDSSQTFHRRIYVWHNEWRAVNDREEHLRWFSETHVNGNVQLCCNHLMQQLPKMLLRNDSSGVITVYVTHPRV